MSGEAATLAIVSYRETLASLWGSKMCSVAKVPPAETLTSLALSCLRLSTERQTDRQRQRERGREREAGRQRQRETQRESDRDRDRQEIESFVVRHRATRSHTTSVFFPTTTTESRLRI